MAVVLVLVVLALAALLALALRGAQHGTTGGTTSGTTSGTTGGTAPHFGAHALHNGFHDHASTLTLSDSMYRTGGSAVGGSHAFVFANEIPIHDEEDIGRLTDPSSGAPGDESGDTPGDEPGGALAGRLPRQGVLGEPNQFAFATTDNVLRATRSEDPFARVPRARAPNASANSNAATRRGPSGAMPAPAPAPAPRRPWAEYASWATLRRDPGATAAYLAQRAAAMNHPDLDWGPVLARVRPLLAEPREYIGVVGWGPGGPAKRELAVLLLEASPSAAGDRRDGETVFASIPGELVARVAETPGLFMFHTHPDDPRCSPLPSSHDLAAAVYFGALGRYAASAVISAYGVLVYGLDWDGFRAINNAADGDLAMLNLSHDVAAAHEATRSWSRHTLGDYFAFYARHRLFVFTYPTSALVGDARGFTYEHSLESPVDYKLLDGRRKVIRRHLAALPSTSGTPSAPNHAPIVELGPDDLGLD